MRVLAEVYRQARSLWPRSPDKVDESVTVRIDTLKVLTLPMIMTCPSDSAWVLSRLGNKEASVQSMPISKVTEADWSNQRTLEFGEKAIRCSRTTGQWQGWLKERGYSSYSA